MKKEMPLFMLAVAVILFTAILPKSVLATTRVVVTNTSQCPADAVTNGTCYTSLAVAITAALAGDAIEIKPGTYHGNFTINQNITQISGDETGRTFLTGDGSGTALTIGNVPGTISIRRLTFSNAQVGILVQNSPAVTITNNAFQVGSNNTAVQLASSPNANITNNTFYLDANGIISDQSTVTIVNNIFANQQTTAIDARIAVTSISNNLFFTYGSIGPAISFVTTDTANYKGNLRDQDPKLVNITSTDQTLWDYHLQATSPCIDTGNASAGNDSVDSSAPDMGAYGGSFADTIPFQVSNVVLTSPTTSVLSITWNPNNAYTVKGYHVYYGNASGVYNGTAASEGPSPLLVTGATTTTLSNLPSAGPPATPTGLSISPLNESLAISWTAVPGATGYKVYYAPASLATPTAFIEVDGATSCLVTNLTNSQWYNVQVSAISQETTYIAVTAVDKTGLSAGGSTPGASHESAYSAEVTAGTGTVQESLLSAVLQEYPDPLIPYPNLPTRQGCFIATAAFGYYSEPNVQALRDFRDRFLVTNGPGRAFVEWYYTHGPVAAAWLNRHPKYKPVVRVVLLPAVGMSLFLTKTSLAMKISTLLLAACLFVLFFRRKQLSRQGGSR